MTKADQDFEKLAREHMKNDYSGMTIARAISLAKAAHAAGVREGLIKALNKEGALLVDISNTLSDDAFKCLQPLLAPEAGEDIKERLTRAVNDICAKGRALIKE